MHYGTESLGGLRGYVDETNPSQAILFEVVERSIDKSELFIADEVFLCGTAAKIAPVSRIENYLVPQVADSITSKLQQELVAITQGQHPDYQDWLCPVDLQ